MSASDFMYFSLGFIFYKYLSEKIELYVNDELEADETTFQKVWQSDDEAMKEEIKAMCVDNLGYFVEPDFLFSTIIDAIWRKEIILPQLERSLKKIEDSTIGQESEDDFGGLFSDIDLASPKLGKTADDKNRLISDVLVALNGIDFGLEDASDIDILGAAAKFNNDDRFSKAGVLAPKSKADYAFILHMIYHLNDGGTMACVAPHGVLFRGSAEGKIRQFLIEKRNYIDAIIGLPANIFYGTSIPTCIIVIKKCRKEGDNVLFIDASKEFEKVKTQNKLRPEHIQKIIDTYRERKEIEKYSHLATMQEIIDNDYNLNIPRYVDTFEEEAPIDIHAVMGEIKELEAKRADLDKQIEVYLKELGIVE
ncbi:MAG: N-6 DNA methylase [Prevotella sp.]|nr:N-6 DNA methylase [Prevotella sp.]